MANEILKNEQLTDTQLDNVTGGTIIETLLDGNELYKRGLLSDDKIINTNAIRDIIHKMGYTGYQHNGGLTNSNIYTDKNGNTITREEFWNNFDAENGTKIIRC